MASKSKSIIGGMTVLGIAGIICKLVGVLFSIPLTYVIGAQGQGIYNAVSRPYNLSADNLIRRAARRGQPNGILRAGKG
mgnify:CR=1 FL=1